MSFPAAILMVIIFIKQEVFGTVIYHPTGLYDFFTTEQLTTVQVIRECKKLIILPHSFQVYKTPTTKYVIQQPVVPDTWRKVLDSAIFRSGMSSPVPCTQHAQTSLRMREVLPPGATTCRNRTSTTSGTGTKTGASATPVYHSQVIYALTLTIKRSSHWMTHWSFS